MSRIEHHSAFGILFYYIIYIFWTRTFIVPNYYFNLVFFFSILPDFDVVYYFFKGRGKLKLTMEYQHHLNSLTHYPLIFMPFFILFIINLILNFDPLFFALFLELLEFLLFRHVLQF